MSSTEYGQVLAVIPPETGTVVFGQIIAVEPEQGIGSGGPLDFFLQFPNLFAKQTRKGCYQEMCGCEAQTEFNIATMENPQGDVMYALEESSCCIRFWCPSIRPFEIHLSDEPNRTPIASYERPCACLMGSCKCCCYQEMVAKDTNGNLIGTVKENFWVCVPGFSVKDANGSDVYNLHQPTCCGGMCVDPCREGLCNCRIPFYIYRPNDDENEIGKIVKVWSGVVKELFTDSDKFEIEFPHDATAEERANLLGALFLINMLFFETSKNDS